MSALTDLLGIKEPSGPGATAFPDQAPIAPPITAGGGGLSAEAASLLTGTSTPAGGPPLLDEAQVQVSPSPASDPISPQNPPVSAPTQAAPPVGEMPEPPDPDIVQDFWARHGRAPTSVDMLAIRAIPGLERSLGRPPRRIEILQFLGARNETPVVSSELQFEPDVPGTPTAAASGLAQNGVVAPPIVNSAPGSGPVAGTY